MKPSRGLKLLYEFDNATVSYFAPPCAQTPEIYKLKRTAYHNNFKKLSRYITKLEKLVAEK